MKKKSIIIFSVLFVISCIVLGIILSITINKDVTAPRITYHNPTPAQIVDNLVNISFEVVDDTTQQNKLQIELYIDNILVSTTTSYIWDTSDYEEGAHTISVKATDRHKNSNIKNVTVIVDNIKYAPPDDAFKIMTYNILESGKQPDWIKVVEEENPDICLFVETGDWDNAGNRSFYQYLNVFNDYFLKEAPYRGYTAQGISYSTSGEAIVSRYPITEFNQIDTLTLDNGETYHPTHDFIEGVVNISGIEVHIIGAHLKASEGDTNEQRREFEQEGIINYMDELGLVPIIYLGDFNSHSPDDVGELAPEVDLGDGPMRMLLYPNDTKYGQYSSKIHNFTDVFRTLNPTVPGYSFGPENPSSIGRIDYIIVNQFFTKSLINSTTGDTPHADTGSDHYSVDAFISINFTDQISISQKLNIFHIEKSMVQKQIQYSLEPTFSFFYIVNSCKKE
ncbi:MAG: endonuclease/exonuclease/phosphatase family protein [Candidatus Heimdallarchaeum endolithica]|uniref:Endonuclease/exonuclease/phosphatase family protein n=1 Tax=Candidatus Heimdallarchaeum endolithica TaxID=2876572 RepID=A0A9Y1BQZ1_9ARCH|nr:MAG: endonuclease/exonuclease/phosphatase family protein [Candidatus Heimdallarchaeum endolithica]